METDHPELLVLVREPRDDVHINYLEAILVEMGVHFDFSDADRLPASLPVRLEGYRAVLTEPEVLAAMTPAERERLDAFRRSGGYVHSFKRIAGHATTYLNDEVQKRVQATVANAGLTRDHPAQRDRLLARSDEEAIRLALQAYATYRDSLIRWDDACGWPWRWLEELHDLDPTAGHRADADDLIERAIHETPNVADNLDRIVGLQGVLRRYEETGEARYLDYARSRIDRVIATFDRVDGAIVLQPGRDRQLWPECLMGFCGSAAHLGRVTGDERYIDEAINEVRRVAAACFDERGLWWHGGRQGPRGPERFGGVWSRGVGWALLGIVELMRHLPDGHPFLSEGGELLRRSGEGLAPFADPATGLWRNLVTHPLSRREGSGTGLIVYALATGLRRRWFESDAVRAVVDAAWLGLKSKLYRGWVMTQAIGTALGHDEFYYLTRPQHAGRPNQFLLAATAMLKLRKEQS